MQEPADGISGTTDTASIKDATTRARAAVSRILVVDDETDACEAIRQVLEGEGYSVVTETSAHRALEKAVETEFDVVLTDVAMAEMNGLDFCAQLLKTRPALPVILITGQGTMDTVIAALRLGARDF